MGVSLAVTRQGCHRKVDIRLRTHARNVQLVSPPASSICRCFFVGGCWLVFKRASLRAFSLPQKLPQGGKGSDYKFSFVKYGRNRHSIFRSLNLLTVYFAILSNPSTESSTGCTAPCRYKLLTCRSVNLFFVPAFIAV